MSLVPPYIETLQPYEPGRRIEEVKELYGLDRVVKLASNENPYGASPLAIAALHAFLDGVNLYPDCGQSLRRALARRFHTNVENVIVGNGSDGIISDIIRTFLCDDDEILTTEGAFAGFQVVARSRGVPYRTVPYQNWRYHLPALAAAVNDHTKLIYLANPNNPTGTYFTRAEFEDFYQHIPSRVLIILDEAYYEFARATPDYPDSLHYRFDNVITLRTFSKAYGLAGLRVGYGFAHDRLIANLMKVRLTFEPNILGAAAAIAALDDHEFLASTIASNERELGRMTIELRRRGFTVIPSIANFLMLQLPDPDVARELTGALLCRGVIIRSLTSFGLPDCVRISVGNHGENQFFLQQLDRIKNESLQSAITAIS